MSSSFHPQPYVLKSNNFILSLMYSKVIWASTEHLSSSFHWTTSYVHTGPHSLIILLFSTLLFCLYLYTCILIYLYNVHLSTISHHCLGFALRELAWVAQRRTSWGDPPSLGSNYKLKIKCRATLGRGVTQLLRNAKTDYLIWWQWQFCWIFDWMAISYLDTTGLRQSPSLHM